MLNFTAALRARISIKNSVRAAAAACGLAFCLTILTPTGEMRSIDTAADAGAKVPVNSQSAKSLLSPTVSTSVVISQVYGGAGCGTAGCSTYQNDYIEIYNLSNVAVTLPAYSVQYAAATGTAWQVTNIPANTVIQPGRYFLIAESFGANGVNPLPTPDVTGTIAMSATAAKVALVSSTTALAGTCPTSATIVDFVGYGATASCFETGVAPAPSTTTADVRAVQGLQDTDNNAADFTATTPNPRNSALAPTAAKASIVGRVLSGGRGLSGARVELVGTGGATRSVVTNVFGNFTFDAVDAGATYVVNVSAKKYTFAPQVVSVTDNVSGLTFTAQ